MSHGHHHSSKHHGNHHHEHHQGSHYQSSSGPRFSSHERHHYRAHVTTDIPIIRPEPSPEDSKYNRKLKRYFVGLMLVLIATGATTYGLVHDHESGQMLVISIVIAVVGFIFAIIILICCCRHIYRKPGHDDLIRASSITSGYGTVESSVNIYSSQHNRPSNVTAFPSAVQLPDPQAPHSSETTTGTTVPPPYEDAMR